MKSYETLKYVWQMQLNLQMQVPMYVRLCERSMKPSASSPEEQDQ